MQYLHQTSHHGRNHETKNRWGNFNGNYRPSPPESAGYHFNREIQILWGPDMKQHEAHSISCSKKINKQN